MADKAKNKKKQYHRDLRKTEFYYSFLTLVLILCLVIMGFSAILNISKLVAYKAKIITLKKTLNDAEYHNKELKEDIKMFSSTQNLEGIARNTLKMAGEDEILIIINNNPQSGKHDKKQKNNEAQNAE